MNIRTTYAKDLPVKASELSDWLLARGISCVTTAQVAECLDVSPNHVRQRLAAPRRKGRFATPARGLWVPVSPEYSTWGAPEPAAYLDAMMKHLDANYYVGWLSAAALHGASHQAPQVFQVAVDKRIEDRQVGRSYIRFLNRSATSHMPVSRLSVPAGTMNVSTTGATMLDIMEDIFEAGGLNNAVTVVVEIAQENSDCLAGIAEAASFHSDTAVRRLGWVLDTFVAGLQLDELEKIARGTSAAPSLLSPRRQRTGQIDSRWNLVINSKVDPDL